MGGARLPARCALQKLRLARTLAPPILLAPARKRDEFEASAMSQILLIVVNVFWLAAILGLVVWIFIRALKRSTNPPVLILKWILTAVALFFQFTVAVPAF